MRETSNQLNINDLSSQHLLKKIAELESAIESLNKTNHLYGRILEKLPFGVQIFDKDGFSLQINSAQGEMLGLTDLNEGIGKFNVLTDPYSIANGASKIYGEAYKGIPTSHEFEYDLGVSENEWDTSKEKRCFREFIIPIENEWGEIQNVVAILDDISEQKSSIDELKESEERFEKVFRMSPVAMIITDLNDGMIIDVNEQWSELTQYTKAEALGKYLHDLNLNNQEDRLKIRNSVIENGHIINYENRITTKTGLKKLITISVETITIGGKQLAIGLAKDFTQIEDQALLLQQKNREINSQNEELKLYGRNFENIFTNSPVGIFVIDVTENGKYVITASNPVHAGFLNIQSNSLEGKPLEILNDIFGQKAYEYIRGHYDRIVASRETMTIEECINVNNAHLCLSTTIRPIADESGRIYRLIGTNLDITELKNTERELIIARDQAEESNKLKTAFLQNISHEVRTPLNAIVGFSSLIAERMYGDEKLKNFAKMISLSSDKLLSIIMDVIEISQIQTSHVEAFISGIELDQAISRVMEPFYDRTTGTSISLQLEKRNIDDTTKIYSDCWKLEKIIFHVLDNAIKFTPKGNVTAFFEKDEAYFRIKITDTGIGISEEQQKFIFEPFRQVETETHLNYGGMGLGLSLVKAYVELLHGKMALESKLNEGTAVIIDIPVNPVKGHKSRITVKNDLVLTENNPKQHTILVAEDDQDSFIFLRETLESENAKVLHASNGSIAVEMCGENPEITLVLMDLKMPVMDGRTAAVEIKKIRPDLPIIAQTAYTEDIVQAGLFECSLTKPIKTEVLKQILSDIAG